jgi:hypothetical protein
MSITGKAYSVQGGYGREGYLLCQKHVINGLRTVAILNQNALLPKAVPYGSSTASTLSSAISFPWGPLASIRMQFYSGPLMHFLSGVDRGGRGTDGGSAIGEQ